MRMKSLGNIFIYMSDVSPAHTREGRGDGSSSGSSSKESPSKFNRNCPERSLMDCPPWRTWLEMAPGLVNHGNTVQDTAGINTWVTNKCVVKGALIAGFVRRVSLWQRRETFVSLFHRWPHGAPDESPPPCFNRPQRQQHHSRSICRLLAPRSTTGVVENTSKAHAWSSDEHTSAFILKE